ncbi:MAG: carbon storage regulator CsrA [Thermodesulfovibrionales bacterium]|nr:carbon storage regulator CsrA [Thermodesulfovibrionales bacterium]
MLVLTRKISESVKIGDDITITIVEISPNSVKIGIKAPHTIKIYRQELYDKIKSENLVAATLSVDEFNLLKKAFQELDKK